MNCEHSLPFCIEIIRNSQFTENSKGKSNGVPEALTLKHNMSTMVA